MEIVEFSYQDLQLALAKELQEIKIVGLNDSEEEKIKEQIFCLVTDSRQVNEKSIFLCLRGQKFDGHSYLRESLSKKCPLYIVEKENKHFKALLAEDFSFANPRTESEEIRNQKALFLS